MIGGSTVGNLAMKLQVEVYKEENYIRLYTGCGSWHEINQLYTFTFWKLRFGSVASFIFKVDGEKAKENEKIKDNLFLPSSLTMNHHLFELI